MTLSRLLNRFASAAATASLAAVPAAASAESGTPVEADYYPITPIPNPGNFVLEVGGVDATPDGRVFAVTRRGEVYVMNHTPPGTAAEPKLSLFASGLQECLGAVWHDGWLYVTQRPEITRIRDTDGDGRADEFETVCDGWGLSGDYHEYAFGSHFDRHGDMWVVLCLTGSFSSEVPFRGWGVQVKPDGTMVPAVSGVRSPGGIGFNAEGDLFYTENQGPWNGSSSLKHIRPGSFQGHPAGNIWYRDAPGMGPEPPAPNDNSRMVRERERIPQLVPPAVMLPHARLSQSPTAIVCDTTNGRFGPFRNQLFIGEQCFSTIIRVWLEKVNGVYQGVAFPFREGFDSGVIGMVMTPDGTMYAGGSDRGWGSRGGKPFHFDRLTWSGRVPFEILTMKAEHDGFTLTFTEPVDPATAADPSTWRMEAWTWAYRAEYGGPEVDQVNPQIRVASVAPDGLSVRLTVTPLTRGHVHRLSATGLRSTHGLPLLHSDAYYTLNEIPAAP